MELGQVLGFAPPTSQETDLTRSGFAHPASYPSPFLDEQKMLRFSKAAHALPSGFLTPPLLKYILFHFASVMWCKNRIYFKLFDLFCASHDS
jgi:hypothetical protein